jgi:hypothetical protein
MFRRSFILATGATLAAGTARADGLPYGPSLTFLARRNGQPIGTHALAFREDAGQQIVTTQINFAVRLLGIVAYRYTHHCQETWSGDQFLSAVSETNDNGDRFAVQAKQNGDTLNVRRREPQSFAKTSSGDEDLEHHWIKESHPGRILPSSHWNIAQIRQNALLNTQTGKITEIAVREVGRETVRTATEFEPATHYAYSGQIDMNQWFDDHERWVKATFKAATDDSVIEYTLQA